MEILIIAVGKLKENYLKQAASEYAKRLGRYARLTALELPEEEIASRAESELLGIEGARIISRIPEGFHIVALDRLGKELPSEALASYVSDLMISGKSKVAFIIGGPLGLDRAVLRRADLVLSMSNMTFPHQLIRIFLLEQLYRSFKIIRNEPYHH